MDRFNEELTNLQEFSDEFLVHCPECGECARVAASPNNESCIRLVCGSCGLAQDWQSSQPDSRTFPKSRAGHKPGVVTIGDSVDPYFHVPLWLTASCCGHELWAYNYDHLSWLRDYIGAKLRERKADDEYGWRNRSLASRLPSWMKDAKNRSQILETIEKLEHKRN